MPPSAAASLRCPPAAIQPVLAEQVQLASASAAAGSAPSVCASTTKVGHRRGRIIALAIHPPSESGLKRGCPREGPLILLFLVLTLAPSALVLRKAEADAVNDPKQKAARGEIAGLSACTGE